MKGFEIANSRLVRKGELGQGTYGTVYQGTWDTTTDVAIKVLNKLEIPQTDVENFKQEIAIMYDLNHPNIVRCYGYSSDPLSLVMELMTQSLNVYLSRQENIITWERRVKISLDIVSGLKFIHERK